MLVGSIVRKAMGSALLPLVLLLGLGPVATHAQTSTATLFDPNSLANVANIFPGQTYLCGDVTAYTAPSDTAGSLTVNGLTFSIDPGALVVNPAPTAGTNQCLAITAVSGTAYMIYLLDDQFVENSICGTITPADDTHINVGGAAVPLSNSFAYPGFLQAGLAYCFSQDANTGAATEVLGSTSQVLSSLASAGDPSP